MDIKHEAKKLPKNTYEISVTLPWKTLKKAYDEIFEKALGEVEVEGFRKGKAPREIAEKNISKDAVYQKAIESLVPRIYEEVVKKEALKPVVSPKIELISAKENEDWNLKFTIAVRPEVKLGDYKKSIGELKAKHKKTDIWVPGKDKQKDESHEAESKQKLLNEILSDLLKTSQIEISDVILEEEVNTRLARLLDEIAKIGLTVESYLKSKNLTMEVLKSQIRREIEETHKLEFILNEIADKEKIQVDPKELETLFAGIKDQAEKAAAQRNSYFYAALLRKQKTLDFLTTL